MAVRYMVQNVPESVAFYRDVLGFEVLEEWGEAFAMVARGQDVLWLAGPSTSAARPMPSGEQPIPGGWNRIVVEVSEFDEVVRVCKEAGVRFRNEPISGPGGTQVLIEDPSGNPVELFSARV